MASWAADMAAAGGSGAMVEVFTTQTADVKASVDTTKYDVSSPTVQTDLETDLKAAYCTTARSCTVTVLSYNNVTFNRRQLSAGHRRLASGEVSATTAASYGTDNTVPTAAAKVDGISFMTGTVTGISSITTVSTPPGSSADTSALTSELGNTSSVQAATGYSVTSTGVTAAHASPPPPPSEPPTAPTTTPPTDGGVPGGTTTSGGPASLDPSLSPPPPSPPLLDDPPPPSTPDGDTTALVQGPGAGESAIEGGGGDGGGSIGMIAGAGGGTVAVLSLFLLTCWLRWRKARQTPALTVQSSNVVRSSTLPTAQKSSGADPSKIEVYFSDLDFEKDDLQPAVSPGPV